nr:hypothetical protein [Solirubrobacterales bacterium]
MVVLALLVTILTLAGEGRRPRFAVREVLTLLAWTVPGLVGGTVLLRVVPERALE